ncbi:FAD-binding protein [Paraburkholderia sp. BL10I2N1]|uniref:electron transfer flavoprotein subunit alpha/FixB family protein n=1 Tax=Paraburkholderia sp. BL10I2N1 TaxID=1938796 RepID=UPI00105C2802|nr:FAD-binding protein [Paraburkholderia sp. BL10I2N1]TDN57772.1 electron transfer flavoprotein alpha subunit [Paraburkholderia sp. BL10I2N1]
MRSLVLGEWDSAHGVIAESTLRVVAAVSQRGLPVDILVHDAAVAEAAARISGIERVLLAACDPAEALLPETVALQLQVVAHQYSLIGASHRTLGRCALPRAAALAGCAFLADITGVVDQNRFLRPLYAGSVIATVTSSSIETFATFRASSFAPVASSGGAASIVALEPVAGFAKTRLIERQTTEQTGRDLANARVVVSGGRGLASKENMNRLNRLAGQMGAALGASRAAVDAGYASNAAQVGQTGKTVAPDVYFAFGISGAIQHLAGMKDSKIIVAANKDPDAPIFSVADFGIVCDLFDVMQDLEIHTSAGPAAP